MRKEIEKLLLTLNKKPSPFLGLGILVMIPIICLAVPILDGINNYSHRTYFERQGRIAEAEFAEHKSRLTQYPNSPNCPCNLQENPTSENCFYFFRVGGKKN